MTAFQHTADGVRLELTLAQAMLDEARELEVAAWQPDSGATPFERIIARESRIRCEDVEAKVRARVEAMA